ncbi:MAG: DUF2300 domain-containing protein [Bdellovibrionales bacterium]|nr:DUF2300 domain-containing protein [Bdellovibrionales bacterium]
MQLRFSSLIQTVVAVLIAAFPAMAAEVPPAIVSPTIVRLMSPSTQTIDSGAPRIPLGSLWKLFVYAYQSEKGAVESEYTCRGDRPDEIFCCRPGESIDRDFALAKSCTPYFEPERLQVSQQEWHQFWTTRLVKVPLWLSEIEKLVPETRVNVDELLSVLLDIRREFKTFDRLETALIGTVLHGTGAGAVRTWGSTLRVKTFTWRDDETRAASDKIRDELGFTGGFAGWLPDGTAVAVLQPGHGRDAFQASLQKHVEQHSAAVDAGCVMVRYFNRYPITSVTADGLPAVGALRGAIHIRFKNGNGLRFHGDGSLAVRLDVDGIAITGRFSTGEYIARVIDREVKAKPLAAAQAFAVAIRTYLYQNAKRSAGCYTIADSSTAQRVSPEAGSPDAIKVARWSDGLILDRVENLRYHSLQSSPNRMSWTQAKALADAGYSFVEILKTAYPTGLLRYGDRVHPLRCLRQPMTEKWILEQSKRWTKRLDQEPGFERPGQLKVCQSVEFKGGARVFSQLQAQEMYVPRIRSREDEISILHEYLHIGFRSHPRGRDEGFIENLAHVILEER